jgi:flagellar hook assembly protein FlgD
VPGSGTVKYDSGDPVPNGTVVFKTDQHQYTGEIAADGTFQLGGLKVGDGLPPGTYKVAVLGFDTNDKLLVAEKFSDADKSGLNFEVKKGEKNHFEVVVAKP